MTLSGRDREELQEQMQSRFIRYASLAQLLAQADPPVQLGVVVSPERNMAEVCHEAIGYFVGKGELRRLLGILRDESPALTALADRLSRSGADLPPDANGDTLQFLCNRLAQEMDFRERFGQPQPAQIFFLPGPDGAMHPSFVQRLRDWTLPEVLRMAGRVADGAILRVGVPWVQWPPKGKEGKSLREQLVSKFGKFDVVAPADAAAIRAHAKFAGRIVLIEHMLYVKYWNAAMVDLLREYIQFWSAGTGETTARFAIFFHVVFPANAADDAAMQPVLAALDTLCGESNAAFRLEPLRCVERDHVEEWLITYLNDRRYEGNELIAELFQSGSCLPMIQVEPELHEFVNRE